jgi:hypothetical protein
MFFVQVQGGTGGGTLVAYHEPATTESIKELQGQIEAAIKAAEEENRRRVEAAGSATPDSTVTPNPPTPITRFVVEMSDQVAFDFALSPDSHKVSYVTQVFQDTGEITNQAYVADVIEATAAPLELSAFPRWHQLRPAWYPDSEHVTIGLLPAGGGDGLLAHLKLDRSEILLLSAAQSGFDQPRSWSPDGNWLAVLHSSGDSLANPGAGRLDLVSISGHRVTVIEGADNASEDSVIGWLKPEPGEG